MPIPAPYDDPPTYDAALFGIFIDAFHELSLERKGSERDGKRIIVYRIAPRDIREWADANGYRGDRAFLDELRAYVMALDTVWVELELKRLKGKQPDGKP